MKLIDGFETWSELDILTGTIFGEARGEIAEGKIGVGLTIRTRVEHPGWWGRNWREVCLADRQFTCWIDHNADVIVRARDSKSNDWKMCRTIAIDVYLGYMQDRLGKPTHYYNPREVSGGAPYWEKRMIKLTTIGNHVFLHDPTIDVKG